MLNTAPLTTEFTPEPVTVEVVRNSVVAFADEMADVLSKAAYNMMIYEVRDYCCGLIDTSGRMISQNRGGLPIFLADLGIAIEDGIAMHGLDGFAEGDVLLMNHGETCGQHLNNVVVYAPCFHEGELVGFAANRAHWVDIGGGRQGFGSNATTDIYSEGLQFRSLKIHEAGKVNSTLMQIIQDNIRYPDAARGDLRAQIASCQVGARRYGELIGRYSQPTVEAAVAAVWAQADAAVRAAVTKIPDGTYEAESFLDNDGRDLETPIRVKATVRVHGDEMTVDFSGMHPQVAGPLNSGRSGGIAAARVAFKAITSPALDVNEGSFRALNVDLPDGTILSARSPAALGQWSIALPTVIDTILKALAPAVPDLIPAAHKGDMGGCSFFGVREDHSRFLLLNIFGGGWGGRPHGDGASASMSVCQGDVRNTPVELQEIKYPFLIRRCALRPDSGGAGQYRGGFGIDLTYEALQDCRGNINFDRTLTPPWGLNGGHPAAVSMALITRTDGTTEKVRKATNIEFRKGDIVSYLTAGGGGYGDPALRDPEALRRDLEDGVVTPEAARRDYGIEITGILQPADGAW